MYFRSQAYISLKLESAYFLFSIKKSNKKNQGCEKIAKNFKAWLK